MVDRAGGASCSDHVDKRFLTDLSLGAHDFFGEALPPGDEPDRIKSIDVIMLAITGGMERTQAQYAGLCDAASLRLDRVIHTRGPISSLRQFQPNEGWEVGLEGMGLSGRMAL